MSIQFAPTWNNASIAQTCIRANATDTASAAASTLIDLSVNGVSQFSVDKTGDVILRESTPQTPPSGYITLYGSSGRLNVINSAGNTTSIIGSINGLTGSTQTFSVGTSGTDFAISSASGVHTFNLPDASATARGVVTTGVQTFAGDKTFSGTLFVGTFGGLLNRIAFLQGPSWRHDIVQSYPEAFLFRRNETGFVKMEAGTGDGGGSYTAGVMIAGGAFAWASSNAITNGQDGANLVLARDAADVLAQRRGTNAQSYRIYNTFTSTTSFERLNIAWSSNVCTINTTAGSAGGSVRQLVVGCGTTGSQAFFSPGRFDLATAGSWAIGNSVSASAYSTFAIGDNSMANTQQTFSVGFYASTYNTTQFSRSTIARPWVVGSAQTSEFRAFVTSAGTSPFEFVWNNNTANRWIIPNNRVWSCRLRVVGVDTTTANQSVVTFDRKFCIARLGSSGTVAIHGGVQLIGTDVDNVGGAAISITADDTNKCANISITAPNANTWWWYGTLYVEDIIRA